MWKQVVSFFKDNQQFDKKYTKHLSYLLQKQRHCTNSYSTIILMLIAYPRYHQKNKESCDQFLIDSGLRAQFPSWNVSACRSYPYLSEEEYIKLLNTHSEGCFVAHVYPRFRAVTEEWQDEEDIDIIDGSDIDDESSTDDGRIDDDDSSMTTSDEDDDINCTSDDNDIVDGGGAVVVTTKEARTPSSSLSHRIFSPPHPSIGVTAATAAASTKVVKSNKSASVISKGDDDDDDDDDNRDNDNGDKVVGCRPPKTRKKNVRFKEEQQQTMLT